MTNVIDLAVARATREPSEPSEPTITVAGSFDVALYAGFFEPSPPPTGAPEAGEEIHNVVYDDKEPMLYIKQIPANQPHFDRDIWMVLDNFGDTVTIARDGFWWTTVEL